MEARPDPTKAKLDIYGNIYSHKHRWLFLQKAQRRSSLLFNATIDVKKLAQIIIFLFQRKRKKKDKKFLLKFRQNAVK